MLQMDLKLQNIGVNPEMAHKEVGGINSSISIDGKTNHAMEQLEISWKFSSPLPVADVNIISSISDTLSIPMLFIT
mgnify:CR=1 FL=1